jgi:hypothetical protein
MIGLMDATENSATPKPARRRWYRSRIHNVCLIVFVLPVAARASLYALEDRPASFRDANWSSAKLLPPAAEDPKARVMVFAARNGTWRSIFAVHTWIVVKPENGPYTRYEVMGFGQPVRVNGRAPDAHWFSYVPTIVGDLRGPLATQAIPKIEAAIKNYAYAQQGDYRIWSGPNSNTFIATVIRAAPELAVALPPTAIGKDFRADYSIVGATPSGTGVELEVFGLLGLKAGWVEGVELNLFTLVAGLDLRNPALKLPGIGRIGFDDITTAAIAR